MNFWIIFLKLLACWWVLAMICVGVFQLICAWNEKHYK